MLLQFVMIITDVKKTYQYVCFYHKLQRLNLCVIVFIIHYGKKENDIKSILPYCNI